MAVILVLAVSFYGCGTSSQEETPPPQGGVESATGDTEAPPPESTAAVPETTPADSPDRTSDSGESVPADLRIVFGEGGGVTGRWAGRTISADGTWLQWEGSMAEDNAQPGGTLDSGDLDALWADIARSGFFDLEAGEPGNLTRFIRVTADGRTHEVRWVPQMGAEESPSPAQRLYASCWKLTSPGEPD